MESQMHRGTAATRFGTVRNDVLASIVVFLVALPLCMGVAIASGMPPSAGLVTGMIGGVVVGLLSGTPLAVSGPAAGLSVMVYEMVQKVGVGTLGMIVLLAGILQIVAGALRFGQWFRAVSPAVIQGMLAGIGVLIFASQFHVMVDDLPKGGGIANLMSIPEAVYKGITPLNDTSTHHFAAMIGLLTILVIMLWKALAPKPLRLVPAPLAAITVASCAAVYWGLPINRVDVPANILEAVSLPSVGSFAKILEGEIILAGLALAFVASAETLLCATAVDKLHSGPRTQYDRELVAQGIGNSICGLLGALPMTSVIVRSTANVQAGARTRAATILHGTWLILLVAAAPFVLTHIPTAGLAAILVFTGVKLMDFKAARALATYGRGEVVIYAATLIMIVVSNLLTGVLVGVALSVAKLLYAFSHLEVRTVQDARTSRTVMHLRGAATFVRLPKLAKALEAVAPNTELHVHLDELDYVDHACLELIMDWERQHQTTGGRLMIDWKSLTAKFRRDVTQNGDTLPSLTPHAVVRP